MTKQKTQKELEREKNRISKLLIVACVVLLMVSICLGYIIGEWTELKQQLSECQEQVPNLSDIFIKNNSKGEHSISVWSKNGALIPSDDIRLQKLNDLISYSHSGEWKYYVYTFEEKYYIDGEQVFPKPSYCGKILDYALTEEQIKECLR